jgi:hypothetical protein
MSAYREEAWWSNSASSVHAKSWLDAGWEVQEANLKEGLVVFKKVRDIYFKKRAESKIDKPFKPVRVRSRRRPPSKTKVSQLYARIKNMERQRAEGQRNIRGLKPRRHYEKKLFKPDEKPK